MRQAKIMTTISAAGALRETFQQLPRGAGDRFVLVYQESLRAPNGQMPDGFVPGHVATVFPAGYHSPHWATGRLPDGKVFSLVPRSNADTTEAMMVDVLDEEFGTFSVTRQREG